MSATEYTLDLRDIRFVLYEQMKVHENALSRLTGSVIVNVEGKKGSAFGLGAVVCGPHVFPMCKSSRSAGARARACRACPSFPPGSSLEARHPEAIAYHDHDSTLVSNF